MTSLTVVHARPHLNEMVISTGFGKEAVPMKKKSLYSLQIRIENAMFHHKTIFVVIKKQQFSDELI